MNQSQKYAIHLDNLRKNRNFTVEEFCFGIVDPRTFRRYKSGDKTLMHVKVTSFCRKLKISTTDFYYSALQEDIYEFQKINHLYNLASSKKYSEFKVEAAAIKKESIQDIQNQRFLDFCHCKVDFETKSVHDDKIMSKLHEIADYPECLNYSAYDFVSLVTLQLIAEIEVKHKKETALNKLVAILAKPEFIYTSSETNTILPTIFSNTSLYLLRLKKFNDVLKVSEQGISYSLRHSDISGLSLLYFCHSTSCLRLGLQPKAELYGILCIMTSIVKRNTYDIDMFTRALKEDLGVDPSILISKYWETLTKKK